MTTISDPEVTTEATPAVEEIPTKELFARFAKIAAVAGAVKSYEATARAEVFTRLRRLQEESGSKSIIAKDTDGTPLVTLTVTEPKDKFVVSDPNAVLDWVIDNFPAETETVSQVRESFLKVLMSRLVNDTEEGVVDTATGSPVPGVKFVPAGDPTSFSTTWKKEGGEETGKKAALAAAFAGGLLELGMVQE